MKTRSIPFLMAICLVTVMLFGPLPASAVTAPYECTVVLIGQWDNTNMTVMLSQVPAGFTNKAFLVPATARKEYMAIMLTAVSTNKNVTILADLAEALPVIQCINLYNN